MASFQFRCCDCGTRYTEHQVELVCPACFSDQETGAAVRGALEVEIDSLPSVWPEAGLASAEFLSAFLPIDSSRALPPLPVGDTPLLAASRLRESLSLPHLWIKDDTRNPSGSTKDRASMLVVAKALEYGRDTVAAASTGNAATALAAVCASTGTRAVVFVPAGAPEAKLVQMLCYGAEVLPVEGSYDDAYDLCQQACDHFGWYNRNTALNPFTVEGKKTAALEIAAQLRPEAPDVVLVPTGDGVIISGVAKGFADLEQAGLIRQRPRLIAVQPESSAALTHALRSGAQTVTPVSASSVADSLNVDVPRGATLCLRHIRQSKGTGVTVSDPAIVRAIAELARTTGVFAEPAGATALAGLHAALEEKLVDRDERIVLLVTGTGLKDVPAAARSVDRPLPLPPHLDAVLERRRLASPPGKSAPEKPAPGKEGRT